MRAVALPAPAMAHAKEREDREATVVPEVLELS